MTSAALSAHVERLERLITLGESVTEALDHVMAVGELGTSELRRTVTALAERALPPATTAALDALGVAAERVVGVADAHRAIDWIGMYPRLVTMLLVGGLNPAALPSDAVTAHGSPSATARIPAGVAFTDAPHDGRAVVYAGIQADPLLKPLAVALADATPAERLVARALMNDPAPDTATASAYFGALPSHRTPRDPLFVGSIAIGDKAPQSNAQFRGAIVEATTAELLRRRPGLARDAERLVRRERRFSVDGASADPHPFDVTVEAGPIPELWDCKWGSRGIDASLLAELEDARIRAAGNSVRVTIGIVVFDSAPVVAARLGVVHGAREKTRIITLETLGRLSVA
jgi:hypothetical protein